MAKDDRLAWVLDQLGQYVTFHEETQRRAFDAAVRQVGDPTAYDPDAADVDVDQDVDQDVAEPVDQGENLVDLNDLDDVHKDDLIAQAEALGVPHSGTKAEIAERIREAQGS